MSHLIIGSNSNIIFKVIRSAPELIRPAKPTPQELKLLSDIDDQEGLRFHIPGILIYRPPKTQDDDGENHDDERRPHAAEVIKAAVAEALVYYYPWAGRLTEVGDRRKLAVNCTGEGVVFIKAEAEVRLEEFGVEICPPFPCYEELLPPAFTDALNSPLVNIQVTRLLCGGIIIGFSMHHTISDGGGMLKFIKLVADIVKSAGEESQPPLLMPVWNRELIMSTRDPPEVSCTHREYDKQIPTGGGSTNNSTSTTILYDQTVRCFFFGPKEVSALRRRLIPHQSDDQFNSTFDVLAACLWRCHTIALQYKPAEEVRALLTVNFRSKLNPPLPAGYYGNEFAYSAAITTAKEISENPPAYALKLIQRAKDAITEEHLRSLLDFLVVGGRPKFTMHNSFLLSDLRRSGFSEVDFGWGRPVYAGNPNPRITSFFMSYQNSRGVDGVLVPIVLPPDAMERFVKELSVMLMDESN